MESSSQRPASVEKKKEATMPAPLSKAEVERICQLLDKASEVCLRRLIYRYGSNGHDQPDDILAEAYVKTYQSITKGALENFDTLAVAESFLWNQCRRTAIDFYRKRTTLKRTRPPDFDQMPELIGEELEGTLEGGYWQAFSPEKRDQILRDFREFIKTLPKDHRRVGVIMNDNFPDKLSRKEIADLHFAMFGVRISIDQVGDRRKTLRDIFRELMGMPPPKKKKKGKEENDD